MGAQPTRGTRQRTRARGGWGSSSSAARVQEKIIGVFGTTEISPKFHLSGLFTEKIGEKFSVDFRCQPASVARPRPRILYV
jgi:hypothetical protein